VNKFKPYCKQANCRNFHARNSHGRHAAGIFQSRQRRTIGFFSATADFLVYYWEKRHPNSTIIASWRDSIYSLECFLTINGIPHWIFHIKSRTEYHCNALNYYFTPVQTEIASSNNVVVGLMYATYLYHSSHQSIHSRTQRRRLRYGNIQLCLVVQIRSDNLDNDPCSLYHRSQLDKL